MRFSVVKFIDLARFNAFGALLVSFFAQATLAAGTGKGPWKEQVPQKWLSPPLKSWAKFEATCDLYPGYWVVAVPYSDRVGSDISVFKRDANAHFPESCDLGNGKAWAHYSDGDYGSVSISNDILFLDSGTDNWRGLQIMSLKTM